MQITDAEVTPVELDLRQPMAIAGHPPITRATAIFVHLVTRQGRDAWGCTALAPGLTQDDPEEVIEACQRCADLVPDLHPTHIGYSLGELVPLTEGVPAALCAFDLAFHDLLGLAAGMPLYRLLGGYRNSIQSSATVGTGPVEETVKRAKARAARGFRILKIKGGVDPDEDVHRVRAVHRALPGLTLRLDADGGYTTRQALDVIHALEDVLEMIEQPTPPENIDALQQVTRRSGVPVLADQSVTGPSSALTLANRHAADGLSIKMATCGGVQCVRQVDAIAHAAHLTTMIGCVVEPAMLTAAGLHVALSSPSVEYGDLDGFLDLVDDPTVKGFSLEDGWLTVSETPGLGCVVEL